MTDRPKLCTFTIDVWEGYTKVFVAQMKELPGIIVQSKTLHGTLKEMGDALDAYLNAFPEERKKLGLPD
jgi:predicted RNase H-like HicB family nuclease